MVDDAAPSRRDLSLRPWASLCTVLYGADGALAVAQSWLTSAPSACLTLLGTAGVGKTTLAAQLATEAEASPAFPGGVVWVSLDGVETHDPDWVAAQLLVALEAPRTRTAALESLRRALQRQPPTLFVLDACERSHGALARHLGDWLALARDSAWLVTSRRALGIRAESLLPLEPLAPEAALSLFVHRARLARRGWTPGDEDLTALRAIAERLDRLPLALELAAARLAHTTPAALAKALAQRLVLRGGDDRPRRHQSLEAAADSMLAMLDETLQRDLFALSLASTTILPDMAAAVLARAPAEVEPTLRALVEAGLARVDGDGIRLYAAVRELCRSRHDALADAGAMHARFARWLAETGSALAAAFLHGDAAHAIEGLSLRREDLRTVLEGDAPQETLVGLVRGLDAAVTPSGLFSVIRALWTRRLGLAKAAGDTHLVATLLTLRARALYLQGSIREATDDLDRALALPVSPVTAEALTVRSATLRAMRNPAGALVVAEESVALATSLGLSAWVLQAEHQRACALGELGRIDDAVVVFHAVLGEALARGAHRLAALCTTNLGVFAERRGRHDEAALRFAEGARGFLRCGDALLAVKARCGAARVAVETGSPEARDLVEQCLAASLDVDDREAELDARLLLATLLVRDGRRTEAQIVADDVRATATACGQTHTAVRAATLLSPQAHAVLEVGPGGWWFRAEGGETVSLQRRPHLRRILDRLTTARLAHAGAPLAPGALYDAGWPGEKCLPDAALERVYTAVRTLRKLGLGARLAHHDGGYTLDAAVCVVAH